MCIQSKSLKKKKWYYTRIRYQNFRHKTCYKNMIYVLTRDDEKKNKLYPRVSSGFRGYFVRALNEKPEWNVIVKKIYSTVRRSF